MCQAGLLGPTTTDEPTTVAGPPRPRNLGAGQGISMSVRYLLPILGLVALIGALVGVKYSQISMLIANGKAWKQAGPPPEAISTTPAQQQAWEGTLLAVGSIAAARGVAVSNDAPGVVARIDFESGAVVRQGQTLVELDTGVERANLASAKARVELANVTAGRTRKLVESGSIAAAQLDTDEAQLKTATTDMAALQAQIDRKIVRAPFAGRLGIRLVNLGQYLNAGTSVTVLEAIDSVYVDFTLPQQYLPDLKVGMPVRVTVGGEGADHAPQDGTIAAVDPEIDATTRTLKVRASLPNQHEKLRPGMFANVSVVMPDRPSRVIVPATAVVHAPYGDSVFVVEDKKDEAGSPVNGADGKPAKAARQQFVRVGDARGDYVAILDGVARGDEVVSSGAFKLRNGSGVVVKNDVALSPQLSPRPENR
jgi:membrane fusion protein (multidrug efflux system)